jgi:hypothetical protein
MRSWGAGYAGGRSGSLPTQSSVLGPQSWRSAIALLLLSLATSGFAQVPVRAHMNVVDKSGRTYALTELVTPNGFITLFETESGAHCVLRYDENAAEHKTTIELRDVDRKLFVRGSFVLRDARERLAPADYVVPFTIETNGFAGTERIDRWHNAEGAPQRAELARHIDAELMREWPALRIAIESGSPAAVTVCRYLGILLAATTSCSRNHDVAVLPAEDDCAFDARFGYPCTR